MILAGFIVKFEQKVYQKLMTSLLLKHCYIMLHMILMCIYLQLAYCVVQFLEKDPGLTESVVSGLLKVCIVVWNYYEILTHHLITKYHQIPSFYPNNISS